MANTCTMQSPAQGGFILHHVVNQLKFVNKNRSSRILFYIFSFYMCNRILNLIFFFNHKSLQSKEHKVQTLLLIRKSNRLLTACPFPVFIINKKKSFHYSSSFDNPLFCFRESRLGGLSAELLKLAKTPYKIKMNCKGFRLVIKQ